MQPPTCTPSRECRSGDWTAARQHYPSSAVLWSSGVVVTADHTVQREDEITVTLSYGKAAGQVLCLLKTSYAHKRRIDRNKGTLGDSCAD